MNRNRAKQLVRNAVLIKAFAEGATIQVGPNGYWEDIESPQFDYSTYRVKPVVYERWLNVHANGKTYCYPTKAFADSAAGHDRVDCIKLVEEKDG